MMQRATPTEEQAGQPECADGSPSHKTQLAVKPKPSSNEKNMKLAPSTFGEDFEPARVESPLPRAVTTLTTRFPYADTTRTEQFLYVHQKLIDRFSQTRTAADDWLHSDAIGKSGENEGLARGDLDTKAQVQADTPPERGYPSCSWSSLLAGRVESPYACASNYGGHQFGHWAGQLGDGRAVSIGSLHNAAESIELQLKGAGITPFSRQGDGKAVLRSSLRETAASVAMEALGVPTTGVLSLCLSGQQVLRDRFYDGRPGFEPGAIVCRSAPSFLRFGHLELPAARDQIDQVEALIRHAARLKFGVEAVDEPANTLMMAERLLASVTDETAALVAKWQALGFVHGVLNTDNMSLFGLTIDYGPFGFMEAFDPNFTPNTTDLSGRRYCYSRQPAVCLWNLERLQDALRSIRLRQNFSQGLKATQFPLLDSAEHLASRYTAAFHSSWTHILAQKFGWEAPQGNTLSADRAALTQRFFRLLESGRSDINFAFRELSEGLRDGALDRFVDHMNEAHRGGEARQPEGRRDSWENWAKEHLSTLDDGETAGVRMCAHNPRIVPKNHVLQEVIAATEDGKTLPFQNLMLLMNSPYEDWRNHRTWYEPAPPERRGSTFQMNSCSS